MNQIIHFDTAPSLTSILLSGANNVHVLRFEAFTAAGGTGSSVGFDQHSTVAAQWSQYSVSASGIRSIVISGTATNNLLVADDLTFFYYSRANYVPP